MSIRKVAVVAGTRIPFCRSMSKYMGVSNSELMTAAMKGLIEKCHLQGKEIGEVVLGAVMKHSRDWNMAREVTMSSALSAKTPAYDIQQACGTSLEATILVANKIALGQIECGIAGGTDTNSDLPIVFSDNFRKQLLESYRAKSTFDKIKPWLKLGAQDFKPVIPGVIEPKTGLTMGQSCEVMAQEWMIKREEQDELALKSHQNAAAAQAEGFYDDLITPFKGISIDNNIRGNSSLEKLSQLRTVFDRSDKGTLTAGNSTPLTDGAACVFLASEEYAQKNNLPILAYFSFAQVAAVDYVQSEGLLMAPAYAVSKLLQQANLSLQDFDFYEIHEAFAAQVLCTLKAWESEEFCKNRLGLNEALGSIDHHKLNIKGGSVAIGHPFAATGARLVASLAKMIHTKGSGRGLISVCTAGGMGVTAILEKS